MQPSSASPRRSGGETELAPIPGDTPLSQLLLGGALPPPPLAEIEEVAVLVVDSDPLLCALIARSLETAAPLRVLGTAHALEEALEQVRRHPPQVVTLDLNLTGLTGIELLRRLVALPQPPAVLVLSNTDDEDIQVEVARVGAQGFLAKAVAVDVLPDAIRALARGEVWFTRKVQGRILREHQQLYLQVQEEHRPLSQLTNREREVLIGAAQGLTNLQIAKQLFVSSHTVKLHMKNVLRKLSLSSRTEAAVLAVREGLLDEAERAGAAE